MTESPDGGTVWRDHSVMFSVPDGVGDMTASIPLPADADAVTEVFSAAWPEGLPDVGFHLKTPDGDVVHPDGFGRRHGVFSVPAGRVNLADNPIDVSDYEEIIADVATPEGESVVVSVCVEVSEE